MHYSGEVENVYTTLLQIYSEQYVYKILLESAGFCGRYDKTFWCFFGSLCSYYLAACTWWP